MKNILFKARSLGYSLVLTPELLKQIAQNPEQWKGKYNHTMRAASFVYIGEGKEYNHTNFSMSNIAIDDSEFRDSLWQIINRSA